MEVLNLNDIKSHSVAKNWIGLDKSINEKARTQKEVEKNKERLNFFNSKTPHPEQIKFLKQ